MMFIKKKKKKIATNIYLQWQSMEKFKKRLSMYYNQDENNININPYYVMFEKENLFNTYKFMKSNLHHYKLFSHPCYLPNDCQPVIEIYRLYFARIKEMLCGTRSWKRLKLFPPINFFFLAILDIFTTRKSTRWSSSLSVPPERIAGNRWNRRWNRNDSMDEETQQHKHDRSREQRTVNLTGCRVSKQLVSHHPEHWQGGTRRPDRGGILPFPL